MSHVAMQRSKPGEPMYRDIESLKQAATMLGGVLVKQSHYTWYGRSVGDTALPEGMTASDLGNNATWVFKIAEPMRAEFIKKHHGQEPYDIGFVEDPNNPGCFLPLYDYWAGGYGLSEVVGEPHFVDKRDRVVEMLCPKLKQHYDMVCDSKAAAEVGDQIEFLSLQKAHQKYPQMFPAATEDTDTWVSITHTEQRIGV